MKPFSIVHIGAMKTDEGKNGKGVKSYKVGGGEFRIFACVF